MTSFVTFLNFNVAVIVLSISLMVITVGCSDSLDLQATTEAKDIYDHEKVLELVNENYVKFATSLSLIEDEDSFDQFERCVHEIETEFDTLMKNYDDSPILTNAESNRLTKSLLNTPIDMSKLSNEQNRELLKRVVKAIESFRAKHFEVCTKYGLVETKGGG